MHLDVAFNEELQKPITAEEAYDLFWDGMLSDKRAFSCPDEQCAARVTCANMDKPEQSLGVQPHFRLYPPHRPDCPYDVAKASTAASSANLGSGQGNTVGPDVFVLHRPPSHDVRHVGIADVPAGGALRRHKQGLSRADAATTSRQLFSVSSVITRWLKYRKADVDATQTLTVGTETAIPFNALFECIYPKRKVPIGQKPRIYWGKAQVSELKPGGDYLLAFKSPARLVDEDQNLLGEAKPSFFIRRDLVEDHPKKRIRARLEQALKENGECIAFIYGTPTLRTQTKDQGTRTFINIELGNIDMVCLHPPSFFDAIRRDKATRT
ncbi:hypothetical protein [Dyella koreensis]|uniref:Uncharacterized protein n=1 Tax=Dyella koreensis TaxID=311235 RepID=A0ABW8K746_9GAMM